MNHFSGWDAVIEELKAEKLRQFHVRGFLIIEENALAVASTLYNPDLEEQLCRLGGRIWEILDQARKDLELSESPYLWLAGVERHVAIIPLGRKFLLMAVCDATASPATTLIPLLAFGQRLLTRLLTLSEKVS
ncbi:MAG: hypothetical protein NZ742_08265 [Acidobacteria bacterium]|nr:hypothetical protein [Acidobacteriota bacterium]MDW7984763.1 hypothetical protein [Acidobacteriota bacterium]